MKKTKDGGKIKAVFEKLLKAVSMFDESQSGPAHHLWYPAWILQSSQTNNWQITILAGPRAQTLSDLFTAVRGPSEDDHFQRIKTFYTCQKKILQEICKVKNFTQKFLI